MTWEFNVTENKPHRRYLWHSINMTVSSTQAFWLSLVWIPFHLVACEMEIIAPGRIPSNLNYSSHGGVWYELLKMVCSLQTLCYPMCCMLIVWAWGVALHLVSSPNEYLRYFVFAGGVIFPMTWQTLCQNLTADPSPWTHHPRIHHSHQNVFEEPAKYSEKPPHTELFTLF